jgi:chromosome segregation ATPase
MSSLMVVDSSAVTRHAQRAGIVARERSTSIRGSVRPRPWPTWTRSRDGGYCLARCWEGPLTTAGPLQIAYRDASGEKVAVALVEGKEILVGRDPKVGVSTRNPSVSRTHARIEFQSGGWIVTDLESSNHCYVNDEKVETSPFAAGDTLRFGNFELSIERQPEVAPEPEPAAEAPPEPEPEPEPEPPKKKTPETAEHAGLRDQVIMLETAVADAGARVEELELRCQELELRESRHEQELDGWHGRHERVREQLDHAQGLLESTRAESAERERLLDELERTVADLQSQAAGRESREQEAGDDLADLKTKVVQRDRRIDELERELDLMEYDLRAVREELEGLEDSLRHDNSETRALEREIALLREVNADKENVVTELKLKIESQAREIYDLKAGTAVQDLEAAKQEVLEQFFEKNREVDRLAEALKEAEHRERDLDGQIEHLAKQVTEKRDLSDHPDFQRKVRELERAQSDRDDSQAALERAEEKLVGFGPEIKAGLDGEIAFLERKNQALTERIEAQEAADETTPVHVQPEASAVFEAREEALGRVDEIKEAYIGWKSNIHLLKTYLDELTSPGGSETQVTVSLSSMRDLILVLREDASSLGSEIVALKDLLARE